MNGAECMVCQRRDCTAMRVENEALAAKCQEVIDCNVDLAGTGRRLMQECARLQAVEHQYHEIMSALRRTKLEHGLCEPIERNACTHCAAQRKLDKLLAEYKGPRVVLASTTG